MLKNAVVLTSAAANASKITAASTLLNPEPPTSSLT